MHVLGSNHYLGTSKNGVVSLEERGEEALRGIKFVGDQKNTCAYFTETYTPAIIFKNWKVVDTPGAKAAPSQWSFTAHPTQFGLAFKNNAPTSGSDYNYGSMLYNKKFDCNDGLFKVNVYFNTVEYAIILLRYYDASNFYALELNKPG